MKKIISALALMAVLSFSLIACGQKEPVEANTSKSETTTSATELATNETTELTTESITKKNITTQATTKKRNPNKKYYVPNNYRDMEDLMCYEIKWNDDDSLRIVGEYNDGQDFKIYDVELNEYGEVLSIRDRSSFTDENGNRIEEDEDYFLKFEYDENHRVKNVMEKDRDMGTDTYILREKWYYNDDGLRVKQTTLWGGIERYTFFEYENGRLVQSTHKEFEPTGEDRIYRYKYDTNEEGCISNVYFNILIPGLFDAGFGEKKQSFTYEKVTKAQYDFFYNTLIYHIIDSNEGIL